MEETRTNTLISTVSPGTDASGVSEVPFVEALAHPACAFRHPEEVVHHPWFTNQEKRVVLLSWVRDELVAEQLACKAAPELELVARTDAVIEALAHYDPRAADEYRSAVATLRRQPKQRFRPNAVQARLGAGGQSSAGMPRPFNSAPPCRAGVVGPQCIAASSMSHARFAQSEVERQARRNLFDGCGYEDRSDRD